jgi:hypothetical protein
VEAVGNNREVTAPTPHLPSGDFASDKLASILAIDPMAQIFERPENWALVTVQNQ